MNVGSASRTEVVVDGVRTSVILSGPDGDEAVVFLHGNPGSGGEWDPLFGPASGFVRCIAPDMPGYGSSDKPRDFDYSAAGYGRHLDGLLVALGVRRAHVVGHDLGGPWGLAWAASRPDQLASLTFMNIGVMPGYRWHRYARLYRLPIVGELLLMSASPIGVRPILQAGSGSRVPDTFVREVVRQYHVAGTRRAVLSFYRGTNDLGATTVELAERLDRPDVPTLVLWGAGDPYVPASYAEVQRRFFPSARVVVLPDSGHWPLVDDPGSVVDEVIPFLRARVSP